MEEAVQFIFQEIRTHNVNIGGQINDIFTPARLARQTPIIRNNFSQVIQQLTRDGVLEERDGEHFLTEQGFNVIHNQ